MKESAMSRTIINLGKIPAVTVMFWLIKIAATTLGETAGDAVTMTLNLGYAIGSVIFIGCFAIAAAIQIAAKSFYPFLYWAVIVATTTAGTTIADFADRSLGIGYPGGTALLLTLLMGSLAIWHRSTGSISMDKITTPKAEAFYWIVILFSQTLGTALGDWMSDSMGFGYLGAAAIFAAALAIMAVAYFYTKISRTLLFWSAFILSRPLGATVGDFLDKPHDHGGLGFSRIYASLVLLVFMTGCILVFPQKAEKTSTGIA